MKNPPILISVIGFFGMIAGFYWLYLGLRMLGFDWFGVLGDFGGQYGNGSTVHEFLVGPRFTKRTERVNVFVHALVGGADGRTTQRGFLDRGLTFGGGGGFDIQVTRRIAIRPLQLDYIGSFVDILEDNIRLGSGIVIRLGGH